jgi:ribosomal subunit interface protein
MDIEIQTQHVEMQPEWRTLIEERLARLAERYPKLIRVHVTLKHGPHHAHGAEEVDIVATYPRATLRAGKREEGMRDAVHAALEALERQLAEHRDEQQRFGTGFGARASGTIERLFADRGYGFIQSEAGEEVYFHRNALRELDFATLELGLPVSIEVEQGSHGLHATRVFPMGEHGS